MSLLQLGYQLTYYLENPPEEGKLTLSKPNDDSITGGCVNPRGHLELRLTLSSDQIPDNLTDYYNVLYPPDFNGPRGTADVYSADVRAFMQDLLTAYKTLLREEELTPPETTPDITITDTTDTTTDPKNTTITLPTGRVVKLSDDILLTHSLSDEQLDLSQPYLYRISDYINPETGRLEDLPIPLIAFKNDEGNEEVLTLTNTVLPSSNEKSYIVIRDNDPSKSYKLYRVSDYINPETGRLEDIPIPSIVFDATADSSQNNYLDGPTYTVYPSYEDITLKPYTLVPDENVDDPSKIVYKLVPIESDDDTATGNYLRGRRIMHL